VPRDRAILYFRGPLPDRDRIDDLASAVTDLQVIEPKMG
jgi:hypothetical protein